MYELFPSYRPEMTCEEASINFDSEQKHPTSTQKSVYVVRTYRSQMPRIVFLKDVSSYNNKTLKTSLPYICTLVSCGHCLFFQRKLPARCCNTKSKGYQKRSITQAGSWQTVPNGVRSRRVSEHSLQKLRFCALYVNGCCCVFVC